MSLDRELLRRVRALDEFDLRRLLLFTREMLAGRVGDPPPAVSTEAGQPRLSYRQQHVKCGKTGCKSCPHGPYWYAYWREDGRLRSRYIGKELPGGGRTN
jgi:hypothetical protein